MKDEVGSQVHIYMQYKDCRDHLRKPLSKNEALLVAQRDIW